nr:hypothetical protein [Burkholderia gladioli]
MTRSSWLKRNAQAEGLADRVERVERWIGLAAFDPGDQRLAEPDQTCELGLVHADRLAYPSRCLADIRLIPLDAFR